YLADYGSVELFHTGATVDAVVTDRLPLAWPCRETGIVGPTALSERRQREAISLAGRAHDALGLRNGTFHVEMKMNEPAPEVIEVNGRLGGHVRRLLRYGTGTDIGPLAISCAVAAEPGDALDLRWDRHVFRFLFPPPARAAVVDEVPSRREIVR